MEAVGDNYGLNFSSQPISDFVIGTKFGDYDGRLIIISEKGLIENYRGGPFFITTDKKFLVSRWHSDLSGLTIYDTENKKVVVQKELPVYTSNWYYFQNEYYTIKWENNKETNEIYRLNLKNFEFEKSNKTPTEIKTGELIYFYNSKECFCGRNTE